MEINFEPIKSEEWLEDMVDLHKEWFPYSYDKNFFKRYVLRSRYITVGAFLNVGIKKFLIGFAIGEVIPEDRFKQSMPGVLVERGWYDFISPWVECVHLDSIGVIDEYRKLNVGTRILELFITEAKKKKAVLIYTNVIVHNQSGIKFIEGNKWHYYGIEKNYYRYNEKIYDSKRYYYILDSSWCQIKEVPKEERGSQNSDGIEELTEKRDKGCWGYFMGMLGYNSGSSQDINSVGPMKLDEENKV